MSLAHMTSMGTGASTSAAAGLPPGLRRWLTVTALVAIVAGGALRWASYEWNKRLQGDVNLFALTARDFVRHGHLYYPMKYEYSAAVEYRGLESPATQHPPLLALTAGVIARVLGTANTFGVLKGICEVAGVLLLVLVLSMGWRGGWRIEALVAAGLAGLSPLLVDFSANGSPYGLAAVLVFLVMAVLMHAPKESQTGYAAAGALSAVGVLLHGALVAIPLTFVAAGLIRPGSIRTRGLATFFAVALVVAGPWMTWNLVQFGNPFYTSTTYYALSSLGLAKEDVVGSIITMREENIPALELARLYGASVANSARSFAVGLLWEAGPFTAVVAVLGAWRLIRERPRWALGILTPAVAFSLVVVCWATYRERFLVPVMPSVLLAAGFGVSWLLSRQAWRRSGVLLLLGAVGWGTVGFFEQPPTRYYREDAQYATLYASMKQLAEQLKAEEPGVVLGYSASLDGGIEAVYWHDLPFVRGRGYSGLFSAELVQRLVGDFDVRYVWTDRQRVEQVRSMLPQAEMLLENRDYAVLCLQ